MTEPQQILIYLSEYVKHIVVDGEHEENSVVRYFRTVQIDGGREAQRREGLRVD